MVLYSCNVAISERYGIRGGILEPELSTGPNRVNHGFSTTSSEKLQQIINMSPPLTQTSSTKQKQEKNQTTNLKPTEPDQDSDNTTLLSIAILIITIILSLIVIWYRKYK